MNTILKTIKKKVTLLRVVQLLTLFFWAFLELTRFLLSSKADNYELSYLLTLRFLTTLSLFIITSILFYIYDQFWSRKKSIAFWSVIILPLIFIHSVANHIINRIITFLFNLNDLKIFTEYFFLNSTYYISALLLFSGLYFAVRYWENAQAQKENTIKSQALAHEAQLQMLRYQINPHFLFNALNTIRATIALDQDKARNTVTLLSDFFRYTLEKDQENANTIGKEIEAIKNYLHIQKIRFEEKLEFDFHIDLNTQNIKIPFFIIHPLVENAVKYGIETSIKPLKIGVKTKTIDKKLVIEVTNSGSLITEKKTNIESTNTGIENINKRLDLVYPENYEFSLKEKDNMVTAKLIIKNIVK